MTENKRMPIRQMSEILADVPRGQPLKAPVHIIRPLEFESKDHLTEDVYMFYEHQPFGSPGFLLLTGRKDDTNDAYLKDGELVFDFDLRKGQSIMIVRQKKQAVSVPEARRWFLDRPNFLNSYHIVQKEPDGRFEVLHRKFGETVRWWTCAEANTLDEAKQAAEDHKNICNWVEVEK